MRYTCSNTKCPDKEQDGVPYVFRPPICSRECWAEFHLLNQKPDAQVALHENHRGNHIKRR